MKPFLIWYFHFIHWPNGLCRLGDDKCEDIAQEVNYNVFVISSNTRCIGTQCLQLHDILPLTLRQEGIHNDGHPHCIWCICEHSCTGSHFLACAQVKLEVVGWIYHLAGQQQFASAPTASISTYSCLLQSIQLQWGSSLVRVSTCHNYCGNHDHLDHQVALAFRCIQWHNNVDCCIECHVGCLPIALVARGLLSYQAQLSFLVRGLLSPSLATGLLWPYSTDASSLAYLLYLPLGTYKPSLAYSMYLPLATYTPLPTYMPSTAYLLCSTSAYFAPLIFALCNMVIVASCKQQHKVWLLRGSLSIIPLHLSIIVVAPCDMTFQNDCLVIDSVLWRCGQSYCGHFMPLRLSMWLIHINQKGWFALARSCLLVAINHPRRHRSLLRHDFVRHNRVDDVVVPRSSLTPAMQHKVWLVVAWHVRLCCNQPLFILVAPCNMTYMGRRVAVIIAINIACCCHPCDWQHIYYLIVASLRLAMVDLLLLHAHLQYNTSHTIKKYHCCCSLAMQHKYMLTFIASYDQQQYKFDYCVSLSYRNFLLLAIFVLLYHCSLPRNAT